MALGVIPARGCWEYRLANTASAATFLKGCVLSLNPARTVREYLSTHSSAYGIAMCDSVNSLPAGKVVVAVPTPGCTAMADLSTGVVASLLSIGQVGAIQKVGNYSSFFTTSGAFSAFSSLFRVAAPYVDDSKISRIEVSPILDNWTEYGSASTSTFAS